jgi:Domain of unknown function (DUF4173)
MRVAALAAALAAAAFLPGKPLGVGVVIVAALVAAVVALAARPTGDRLLVGTLALALTVPAVLHDATWVIALDLTAAWILATLAVGGPRLSSLAAPFARLSGVPALAPPAPHGISPALRGGLLALVVAAPFAVLFSQADAAFAQLGREIPLPAANPLPGQAVTFVVVLAAALGLALAAARPFARGLPRPSRKLTPWEWAVPLVLLNALFLAFVLVQVAVLFGGRERVLRTAGLTYAEYARQGFWQLLGVAGLTLCVLGAAALVADATRRRHRALLHALCAVLCALTVVVLVSTVQRLLLYENAFGLTRLRLFVTAFALWLGGLFALLAVAGHAGSVRRRLAHVAVVGTALALLGFSLASPDRLIAERNVDRWRETGRIDESYLRGLSADAVPALVELPAELGALDRLRVALADPEPWSSFNLARRRARDLLGLDS